MFNPLTNSNKAFITSVQAGIAAAGTGTPGNITSIALGAGSWIVSGFAFLETGAATTFAAGSSQQLAIGTQTGALTGTVDGYSRASMGAMLTAPGNGVRIVCLTVPAVLIVLPAAASVFLVGQAQFAGNTPLWIGSLVAQEA